jgi:hypothetical protein
VSQEDLGHPALAELALEAVAGGKRRSQAVEELRH